MKVQELKLLVNVYKAHTNDAYNKATEKHSRNDNLRKLRKINTALNMLDTVPSDTELIGHVQPNNIGDIFEAVECYHRSGEMNRSPKGKSDLTLNGKVYEMKSLEGKDSPSVNMHERIDKGVFLFDGKVYELNQESWETILQKFTFTRPSERKEGKVRIRNNAEIKNFIRTYGEVVRDFS
jgi:hypothetical protein